VDASKDRTREAPDGRAADLLRPVFDALMAGLKLLGTPVHVWSEGDRGRSATAQAPKDRAPAPDPGARKTKTGWFRALARDERPWDGMAPPDVAFTYAPGRGGKHAETILDGFKGVLQGEADQRAFQ
jgi:hypothetical protein